MGKVDRDPRARPEAEATHEDEVPPLHVLVARDQQERRETEDLLAGFDRARRPRRTRGARDFVDHYAGRSDPSAPPPAPEAPRDARPIETPIHFAGAPRRAPPWLPIALAVAAMLGLGVAAALLVTSDPKPPATTATVPAIGAQPTAPAARANDVPPPDPANPPTAVATAIPTATARPAEPSPAAAAPPPRRTSEPSTSPTPTTHDPARGGFIREL